MRTVRMIVNLSGGGPGGRDWRDYPAGAALTAEDWEAEDLIRIGLAVPAPDAGGEGTLPEPEPPAVAETEPGAAAGSEDTGISPVTEVSPLAQTALTSAGALPPEPAAEPEPPAPGDVKQKWVDYAVARGENPDTAAAMTKADLMSKYGSRM
jgi:hypothetical protein